MTEYYLKYLIRFADGSYEEKEFSSTSNIFSFDTFRENCERNLSIHYRGKRPLALSYTIIDQSIREVAPNMKFKVSINIDYKKSNEERYSGVKYLDVEVDIKDPVDEYIGQAIVCIKDITSDVSIQANMDIKYYLKNEEASILNHIKIAIFQKIAYEYADYGYDDIRIYNFKASKIVGNITLN